MITSKVKFNFLTFYMTCIFGKISIIGFIFLADMGKYENGDKIVWNSIWVFVSISALRITWVSIDD